MLSQESQFSEISSRLRELESTGDRQQRKLAQMQEALQQERSKVQNLEAELAILDVVKEGLGNDLDKVYALSQ